MDQEKTSDYFQERRRGAVLACRASVLLHGATAARCAAQWCRGAECRCWRRQNRTDAQRGGLPGQRARPRRGRAKAPEELRHRWPGRQCRGNAVRARVFRWRGCIGRSRAPGPDAARTGAWRDSAVAEGRCALPEHVAVQRATRGIADCLRRLRVPVFRWGHRQAFHRAGLDRLLGSRFGFGSLSTRALSPGGAVLVAPLSAWPYRYPPGSANRSWTPHLLRKPGAWRGVRRRSRQPESPTARRSARPIFGVAAGVQALSSAAREGDDKSRLTS